MSYVEGQNTSCVRIPANPSHGFNIDVDLNTLIENIHISPLIPDWLEVVLNDILLKYNLTKKVRHSMLKRNAYF